MNWNCKRLLQSIRPKMLHRKELYPLAKLNSRVQSAVSCLNATTLRHGDYALNEVTCKTKDPTKDNSFLGFIYTFLTSILFTLASVFVKKLSYIDAGQLSFVRNAGVFAGCIPIAIYSVKEVFGARKDRIVLLLRGFFGATALYFNLLAFRYLPLAEAAILMSTLPAATTIIARFLLKESCGRVQVFGLVLTFCGALLSVRLPELVEEKKKGDTRFDSAFLGGVASSVGSVIFLSLTCVLLRKMKDIHFSVPLLYFGVLGSIENAVISFSTAPVVYPSCGWDQIFVMLIGIFGFMGHCMMTLSFQVEAAGIITVIRSSMDIIIAMIFQIILFNSELDVYNITGACLVIVSASIIGLSKWLESLPEDSKARNRLKCLLR